MSDMLRPPILLFLLVLAVSCAREVERAPVVRPVKVFRVHSMGYVNQDYAGMAVADQATNLAFTVSGQIVALNIEEGKRIPAGYVIAEINPRDFRLSVESARSAYVTAQAQLQRSKRLVEQQAISQQDYEIARTQYAEAKAAYENAEGLLYDTRLRAPFPGVVEKQYVDNYQRVGAGESVVRLVRPVTRKVRFTMPESGLSLLRERDKHFTVEFDNYRGVEFAAVLREYVPTSLEGTGVPVSLVLDDPRLAGNDSLYVITPGMSCTVNLRIDNPDEAPETSVPVTAVFTPDGSDRPCVWIVTPDRTAERREVILGELFGTDRVIVRSGLSPGDEVVTAGVYQIREGETVKILKTN